MDRLQGDEGCRRPWLVATSEDLEGFKDDVQYLWTSDGTIPVYDQPPSPLDFLRNHVAVSRPCIIRNAILQKNGKPLHLSLDDLIQQCPELKLQVDVTPDGHGDCLRKVEMPAAEETASRLVFIKPMELEMTISEFSRHLRNGRNNQTKTEPEEPRKSTSDTVKNRVFPMSQPSEDYPEELHDTLTATTANQPSPDVLDHSVLYYSRQNDCLRQDLATLWNMRKDAYSDEDSKFGFPRSFDWAEQAFFGSNSDNKGPDAINLWIGDERAVSAMHKDHYENLFYVLSGEKVFSLCPPADAPFLYEQQVISGRFTVCQDTQGDNNRSIGNQVLQNWHVSLDTADAYPIPDKANGNSSAKVHWIAADPFGKQEDEFPLLRYTHPIPDIRVKAGELLYLPSLWFHSVTQVCETIGINYWYDMNFESPLWCYFHFLQQLKAQMGNEKMADVS